MSFKFSASAVVFQFQSGAIQRNRQPHSKASSQVSIPKWCDSKQRCPSGYRFSSEVSIPKWCDSKRYAVTCTRSPNLFQFQSGAIQSDQHIAKGRIHPRFNSKVVRFKEVSFLPCFLDSKFQFQSGAIQSVVGSALKVEYDRFNSKVVRFKDGSMGFEGTGGYTVSIPKWCDSKHKVRG